jgi:two-component system KDP operon response regulator KdpE
MTRVLVVDDEPQLRRALDINLRIREYDVDLAATGEEALQKAAQRRPDLIILDLGLPGIDGIDVIRGLRGWTDIPIIVLTVRDMESAKILALDAGADDYITKPFALGELLARVRAALRRAAPPGDDEPVVSTESFTVDLAAKQIRTADQPTRLTPTEWLIVETLVRNEGRLVTQRQLLERVWGPNATYESNLLRVHMAHIRRKLEPNPSHPRYFHTEAGMGYRFSRGDDGPVRESGDTGATA